MSLQGTARTATLGAAAMAGGYFGGLTGLGTVPLALRAANDQIYEQELANPHQPTADDKYIRGPMKMAIKGLISVGFGIMSPFAGAAAGAYIGNRVVQNRSRIAQVLGTVAGAGLGLVGGAAGGWATGMATFAGLSAMDSANAKAGTRDIVTANENADRVRGFGAGLQQFDGYPGMWQTPADRETMITKMDGILEFILDPSNDLTKRREYLNLIKDTIPVHFSKITDSGNLDSTFPHTTIDLLRIASQGLYRLNKEGFENLPNLQQMLQNFYEMSLEFEVPHAMTRAEMARYDIGGIEPWTNIPQVRNKVLQNESVKSYVFNSLGDASLRWIYSTTNVAQKYNDNLQSLLDSANPALAANEYVKLLSPSQLFQNKSHFSSLITFLFSNGYQAQLNSLISLRRGISDAKFEDVQRAFENNPTAIFNLLNSTDRDILLSSLTLGSSDVVEAYSGRGKDLFNRLASIRHPVDEDVFWDDVLGSVDYATAVENLSTSEILNALEQATPGARNAMLGEIQNNNPSAIQNAIQGRQNTEIRRSSIRNLRRLHMTEASQRLDDLHFSNTERSEQQATPRSIWEKIREQAGTVIPGLTATWAAWDSLPQSVKDQIFRRNNRRNRTGN